MQMEVLITFIINMEGNEDEEIIISLVLWSVLNGKKSTVSEQSDRSAAVIGVIFFQL